MSCYIWFVQLLLSRRMEDAVNALAEASILCKKIALKKEVPPPGIKDF